MVLGLRVVGHRIACGVRGEQGIHDALGASGDAFCAFVHVFRVCYGDVLAGQCGGHGTGLPDLQVFRVFRVVAKFAGFGQRPEGDKLRTFLCRGEHAGHVRYLPD